MDTAWPDDIDACDIIPALVIEAIKTTNAKKTPRTTGQPGHVYLEELLTSNPKRIYDVLRMKKETFFLLCTWLEENAELKPTRRTTVQEQVAMFLWTLNFSASNRQVAEQFQHSGETVSRFFHLVLAAMLLLHQHIVKLPTSETPPSSCITNNPKYAQYFTDCIGALDGTHIDVHLPPDKQARYRNRKGYLSQNVLAACNFDMEFLYVLAGWEGSAHDGTVLRDAQHNHGFKTPEKKYWLGDAGYPNTDTVLVPYRSTRYHLKEQHQGNQKPGNSKELFNLRHASLRNVIERIFGVLKRKYQILQVPSEYSIDTQTRIVLACTALHNWVRSIEGKKADILLGLEDNREKRAKDIQPAISYPEGVITSKKMDAFRNQLAEKQWIDYQKYINNSFLEE